MTLLWAFPWPHNGLVDFIPHLASQVEDRDPLVLLVLLVLLVILGACVFQFFVRPARSELHRQVARIPVVTWRPLHHQAPCDGANDVTHVDVYNLLASGLVGGDEQNIDIGDSERALWRAFEQFARGEELAATGAAAGGRVAWAWACWAQRRAPIVWVQRSTNGQPHARQRSRVCLLGANVVTLLDVSLVDELQRVRQLVEWAGVNVIFLDGVPHRRQELADTMFQFTSHAYLHHQAPCDGVNGVTHVDVCNLSAGGWPVDKQRIFVRSQVAGQWRRLQELLVDEDHSTLKVEGPPGTGKSTVTWAWACYVAQQRSVVWVHCDQHDRNMIALLGGGRISWWTLEPERANELVAVAKGVALWVGATLLIVDGVTAQTSTLLTSAAQWATAIPGRHAVTVSSSQFVVRNHIARNLRLDVMTIFSWDFDEYVAACRDDDPFWEQVKVILGWVVEGNRGEIDDHNEHQGPFVPMQEDEYKAVLIRRKFAAAGHSARWMFFETLQQLTDTIIPTTVERVKR